MSQRVHRRVFLVGNSRLLGEIHWEKNWKKISSGERICGTQCQQLGQPLDTSKLSWSLFGSANLIHAAEFYHSLRNFPGGAASARGTKDLQRNLVLILMDVA
jgi:hypothetical protein